MARSAGGKLTLTGFADEIAPGLDEQLDVLEELGISYFDLRQVDEINVLDLSDDRLDRIEQTIEDRGFGISSIGSPIGKVSLSEPFDEHLTRYRRALEVADRFDVDYIRLFSYYVDSDAAAKEHREEIMHRMRRKVNLAEEAGVTLVHENEKPVYGDIPVRCRDLLVEMASPAFRAAFDPANFVELGVEAYPDALVNHVEYVDYLHIKDAVLGEPGEIRPAGEGDGQIEAVVRALDQRGFEGFASLEPHLLEAGARDGFSGPEGFRRATEAFTNILDEVGIAYE